MSHANHITAAQLDALIDGELAPQERARAETHLAGCQRCQAELRFSHEERELRHAAWQFQLEEATESIDWDRFEARVMADVEGAEFCVDLEPCEPQTPAIAPRQPQTLQDVPLLQRLQQRLFGWVKAHPGLLIASAATAGILLLFALPAIDPGPGKNDKIVLKVIKSKTAKVSVLRSRNKAGRSVTVIVVKEPPSEDTPKAPPSKPKPSPHKPR